VSALEAFPLQPCVFCTPSAERIFLENDLCFAFWDAFPVTDRHALIVPRRHEANFFELSVAERDSCSAMLRSAHDLLRCEDPTIEGFNIGVNVGASAGQTVFHCHIHLIPRRTGDVANPRGGVRNVFPEKGDYR
jgi:ATP adenylyltransferase